MCRIASSVAVPPDQLLIMDNRGEHIRTFVLGPYNEGDTVDITCEALGGECRSQSQCCGGEGGRATSSVLLLPHSLNVEELSLFGDNSSVSAHLCN